MDQAVVTKLLQDAKALYDLGKFSTLYQAEFFAAMEEQFPLPAPSPPPSPAPAPESDNLFEESDGVESTATVTPATRRGK
jgi:hypothetical protein